MIGHFKTYNAAKSASAMQEWIQNNGQSLPSLDSEDVEYTQVRNELTEKYNNIISQAEITPYQKDVEFGYELYRYLKSKPWFSLRVGLNTDFWRYLSVMIIPHIVADRFDFKNEDHYWKKPVRIWLKAIWWYCYLADYGDIGPSTKTMLLQPMFNTDTILNLVERPGKRGTDIGLYHEILTAYSNVPLQKIKDFNKNRKSQSDTLFRAIMRLNTSRIIVMEPNFCLGGIHGYVNSMISQF